MSSLLQDLSRNLDESEVSAYAQEPTICVCKTTCQRKMSQRGGCPCRSMDNYCNLQCKCSGKKCKNKPPPESSSEDEPAETVEMETAGSSSVSKDEQFVKNYVKSISRDKLEHVAVELLMRQPDFLMDVMENELPSHSEGGASSSTGGGNPSAIPWCKCGHCQQMPTEVENKCCKFGIGRCITDTDAFRDICLNTNVLGVNMRIREDELADEEDRSNANYRHYAYRGYVYWRFGRLGKGTRLVIPSCCVLKIRARFPSPGGVYTGFIPGANLPP